MFCWCTLCFNKNVPFNFSCISRKSLVCFEGILMLSIESAATCMFVTMFENKKTLRFFDTFHLCAFRHVRKLEKRDYLLVSSCLFLCLSLPSAWNNSAPTGRGFLKFDIWIFFKYLSRKVKFQSDMTRKTGTLHED